MAKELPYFKFEPSEWENGNIQMCSREEKGLFIDLCALYWSRLGDVPLKLAIQKLCAGNATAFDSLIDSHLIRIKDASIYIEFLEEQLQEFGNLSEQNKKNALLGWEKRRQSKDLSERNATAYDSQCENDAIREEKKIEDKKKEDKKNNKFDFKNSLIDLGIEKEIVEQWLIVRKKKNAINTEIAFKSIEKEIYKSNLDPNECIKIAVENSWKGFKAEWLNNLNNNNGKSNTSGQPQQVESFAESSARKTAEFMQSIMGEGKS